MTSRYAIAMVLVVLGLAAAAPADVLYANVPVSDDGTSNDIAYPNTSRNVAIGLDGTIYVVYRDSSSIRVARSTNRGQSFLSSVQVNTSSLEAEIAADANGVVYVGWVQSSQAMLSRSTDSGVSFSTPSSLGTASGTVHMAVDAPYVYLITKNGATLFRNSSSGAGAFNTTTVDSSRVYADVHVDPDTGDVYVQTDDPTVRVFKSTDRGATFDGPNLPGSSVSYSTTVLASTDGAVYLYTCGSGNTAIRIDVSDYSPTSLTFGTTSVDQGRTLAVDAYSNVIDGYVDGSNVKYAISTNNGASFDTAVTIAAADYLSLALSRRYGDIVAVYQQSGEIYCNVYGSEILQAPTVDTSSVSNITTTTATCGGNVVTDGGESVTARGVCWSTSADPTTADSKTTDGTGTGSFTSSITGLSSNTTYHVRAYATNSVGTSYGSDVEYTTDTTPTVTTTAISNITTTTADSGGNVTSDGGASVTARGVCWSTSVNPTTTDSKTTDSTGTGSFTSSITGLSSNTTYHVRAYATNSVGTSYGSDVEFTTDTTPTVTTTAISNITGTTASSGGNVTSDGGASVTARGVCWSTSADPTTADSKTTDGTGTGSFTSSITGLSSNTTYHVRAYATNSVGTSYGSDVELTTDTTPTVTTTAITSITGTTASSGGNVTADGGESVTARGVCWSTSADPTTADSKTTDSTGTGSFTSSITALTPGTTYYVRAYATNSVDTSYGNELSFVTYFADVSDYCPYDPYKTTPGLCGCGVADIDTDGDGTVDCNDDCPDDADKTDAGVCGCGIADIDTDGDDTFDCNDDCPDDADKINVGVCGCGVPDTDADRDGTPDCNDECPHDPNKTDAGIYGCGVADTDTDGDGTPDSNDECPDDADKTDAGTCGCGVADTDADGDGTPDCNDACPENPDKTEPGVYGCYGEATAGEDETAEVNSDTLDAFVEGLEEGTHVTVLTDAAGTTTLTVTDSEGNVILTVRADALGDGARIDVSLDESGNPSVTIILADGMTLMVSAFDFPTGIQIYIARDDQNRVVAGITDDSRAARSVIVEAVGADRDVVIDLIYNMPEQEAGQVIPGFEVLVTAGDEQVANTDSVTIEARGLLGSAVITVALEYKEADYAGGEESELRLHRLDDETGQYLPAGTNDVGDSAPTQTLDDYGVCTAVKTVWAHVNELGTFAAGIPKQELPLELIDPPDTSVVEDTQSARGAGMCGAFGMLCLPMTALTMMAMRRRRP